MAISRHGALNGAGATIGAAGVQMSVLQPVPAAAAGRTREHVVGFTAGWRFALVNTTGAAADQPAPDDPGWREVSLPHDWSIGLDPVAGPHTRDVSGYLPGGLAWYRKEFILPLTAAGRRVSVEFEGVYMDAEVYFNGRLLTHHPYGYTGFAVDLTEHAHADGATPNEMAVRVRNQIPSSRWFSGSGIYRDARLVVTDPVHVVRHGVHVTTPGLAEAFAAGHAHMRVAVTAVSAERDTHAEAEVTLRDAAGRAVATESAPMTLPAGEPASLETDLRVVSPRLWSLTDPYLYSVDVTLRARGRVVDATRVRCGLRWFALDPDHGFSLNGEGMKLRGVNLHHDLGALGAEFHRDAAERQLLLMRRMGVNALRTSHNPPAPGVVELCEELGIVMIIEAFDCWRTGKNEHDYGRFFDAYAEADIGEMVHAAKNSPAVVMWSIGNETYDTGTAEGPAIVEQLIAHIRAIDTTRPITLGAYHYRSVPAEGSPPDRIMRLLDGMGLNYNSAASIDALHTTYPDKFLYEAESSSSTSTRGMYDNPGQLNTGEDYTPGRRGTSSYDNNLESWTMSGEYALKKDRDRPFFAGQFLWTGLDYLGEPTPFYGVFPVKSSFFGAVDSAGFPKDQFYLFASQWTSKPMVHLLPMDWTTHRPGQTVTVWAYANVETVELFLNGRSLGVRRFDRKTTVEGTPYLETTEPTGDDKTVTGGPFPGSYTSPNGSAGKLHLTWEVPFESGTLIAIARRGRAEVARDTLRTAGPPAALRLTTEHGRALTFVTIDVTDAAGVVVPDAAHPVTVQVAGPGRLAGMDSGQQESAVNYQAPTRPVFHGKVLAIVQRAPRNGRVTLTATAPGLPPATLTLAGSDGDVCDTPAETPAEPAAPAPAPATPTADASFSGSPETVPAAMLDGKADTAWSNRYQQEATGLLPEISKAHPTAWVSLAWPRPRRLNRVSAAFTIDDAHALPTALTVSRWTGTRFVPVANPRTTWPVDTGDPVLITFAPVRTTALRLDMTSAHPGQADGFLRLVHLTAG
ncbi:glycoside hydrolase family 2 TIM barrel-domain containing protein [Streptomyces sp. 184]|uniref:glycoside hydrolase family 2 TIM barrel-domain containing protein n=1 Tax=Streptomyces sp. 184 TaxID=1827526 RepID=UPI003892359A